jgi:NAD(P)-dependent dehydrogenase (short-subunit alcohol dehydrogenase family)
VNSEPTLKRVAVVTGASSGIGEQLARALAGRGWHCVLLARREERLRPLADELGGEYELCDVSDREAVEAAAARILERHPRIHLLVNNAGIPARTSFLTGDPARIEQVTRTNYLGSVWCTRAFLPGLEAAAPSDLVNIVSVAGEVAQGSGPYAASKHAQLAFSRVVAGELGARGVRVHTVKPGFVETEGFPQRGLAPPLRRLVVGPDRIARHVLESIERERRETTVPAFYRVAAILQAVAPNFLFRILFRRMIRA